MVVSNIQSHGDVCGNCFRRTQRTFERNFAVDQYRTDDGDYDTWLRKVELPDRSYGIPENCDSVPADEPSDGVKRVCVCGYPRGEQQRPLPKPLFLEYAENLAKRLKEFGVEFSEDVFFEELRTLKSNPAKQFADDRMYDTAAQRAIQHERRIQRNARA